MNHLKNELPVTVVDGKDHFATEPSNVPVYQHKGEYRTSLQQHFPIPQNIWGPVRNHFIMASSVSANPVDRQRSLDQLRRMSADGDAMAADALQALDGLEIQ
jgi:hypothetical protein